ncbi:hypothetical protein BSKO_07827 [Bryopsis sp. KO-2023]|nr:hypothetical protein BSKO_07827 [Bryopsis sp. KO-2023]
MAAGRSLKKCGNLLCVAIVMMLAVAAAGQKKGKCQTGDNQTLFQVLQRMPDISVFTSLIRQAKIIPTFNDRNKQFTIFAPYDYAFGNILPKGKGFFDLIPDEEIAKTLVNFHMAVPAVAGPNLKDGMNLTAGIKDKDGDFINFTVNSQLDPLKPFFLEGPINEANISKPLGTIACNSVIYKIDSVLLPSDKLLVTVKPKNTVEMAVKEAMDFELLVTPRDAADVAEADVAEADTEAATAEVDDAEEEAADAEEADADAEADDADAEEEDADATAEEADADAAEEVEDDAKTAED